MKQSGRETATAINWGFDGLELSSELIQDWRARPEGIATLYTISGPKINVSYVEADVLPDHLSDFEWKPGKPFKSNLTRLLGCLARR